MTPCCVECVHYVEPVSTWLFHAEAENLTQDLVHSYRMMAMQPSQHLPAVTRSGDLSHLATICTLATLRTQATSSTLATVNTCVARVGPQGSPVVPIRTIGGELFYPRWAPRQRHWPVTHVAMLQQEDRNYPEYYRNQPKQSPQNTGKRERQDRNQHSAYIAIS